MRATTLTTAHVPGVQTLPALPPARTTAARHRIEQWFAAGRPDPETADLTEDERQHRYTYVSYGDTDLRGSRELHRCIRAYVPHLKALVGTDLIYGRDLQIAPRFPGELGGPHIDGMGDEGRMADPMVPTAVLGIYLSDVGPDDGALGVWPQLRDEVAAHGRRCLADPTYDPDQSRYRDLMARARDLPPTALTGPAGSAFLLHGGLPHCNLLNTGLDVRQALFLRFYRARHYPGGNNRPNAGRALSVLADPGGAWG